jgi:hypothetical protein
MDIRSRTVFLVLILAQAAHSIEEYALRLFDVFAPARGVTWREYALGGRRPEPWRGHGPWWTFLAPPPRRF